MRETHTCHHDQPTPGMPPPDPQSAEEEKTAAREAELECEGLKHCAAEAAKLEREMEVARLQEVEKERRRKKKEAAVHEAELEREQQAMEAEAAKINAEAEEEMNCGAEARLHKAMEDWKVNQANQVQNDTNKEAKGDFNACMDVNLATETPTSKTHRKNPKANTDDAAKKSRQSSLLKNQQKLALECHVGFCSWHFWELPSC